jgi:hypothetical protein
MIWRKNLVIRWKKLVAFGVLRFNDGSMIISGGYHRCPPCMTVDMKFAFKSDPTYLHLT